jgi:Macrocin-O-methyltransferase (TylF)
MGIRNSPQTKEMTTQLATGQDYSLGPLWPTPLLRHVLECLYPRGCALEFGVADGDSLRVIAGYMPVVGFDSFEGLPEDFGPYPAGSFACDIPAGLSLVSGWFAHTLPTFDFNALAPIGLVHIDCDLYSSTATVLDHVGPHLRADCYLVFDEWHGRPWHYEHEPRAWREHAQRTGATWDVIGHDEQAWAIQLTQGRHHHG